MRVIVWDGDGETFLGHGEYVGEVKVHFFRMPDGSLRSESDASQAPARELMEEMERVGGEYIGGLSNPKIVLDNGKTVYGCQVWWQKA